MTSTKNMIGKRLSKSVVTQDTNDVFEKNSNFLSEEKKTNAFLILKKLKKDPKSYEFRKPVDWEGLGILTYPLLISNPMDISTVEKKLKNSKYKNIQEFFDDLQLIWTNCKTFNLEDSTIYADACYLESLTANLIKQNFSNGEIQTTSQKLDKSIPNKSVISPQINPPEIQKKNNFSNSTENVEVSESTYNININKAGESNIQSVQRENDNKMLVDKDSVDLVKQKRPDEHISILERINLVDKIRRLDNDSTCSLVKFLYFLRKDYIEDVNEEKLQIRIDLIDRDTFHKLQERMTEEGFFSNADDLEAGNQMCHNSGELQDFEENEINRKVVQARVNKNKKQKI